MKKTEKKLKKSRQKNVFYPSKNCSHDIRLSRWPPTQDGRREKETVTAW
nr:MAG TPA: hypothetical protein [Caudoviricetes sp.]